MEEAQHLLDFQERLLQLTDLEAVKEAYFAYIGDAFRGYRLCKTPPALSKTRVGLTDDSRELAHLGMTLSPYDACLFDELVCIVGHRDSLGRELAEWLEKPRALTLDRLQRLLLLPQSEEQVGQAEFLRTVREIARQRTASFAALFVHIESARGLEQVLEVELPKGSRAFTFSHCILAALVPETTELNVRWPTQKAVEALRKMLIQLEQPQRPCASVACWPTDATTVASLVLALQQGLQDARRLTDLPGQTSPTIVYASNWFEQHSDGSPGTNGGLGRLAFRRPVDPDLRGGNARRLED